jgi:hypothetical protein
MNFGLIFVFKAVPRFKWFSLSTWRSGFEAGQLVWGFLDINVAVGQSLVMVLRYPTFSIIPPFPYIHLNNRTRLETIKQYCVLSVIRKRQSEDYSNVRFSRLCIATVISFAIPRSSISVRNMTGMLLRTENICLGFIS